MSLLLRRTLNPLGNAAALAEVVALVRRHRNLILEMTKREVRDRYAGSALGVAWAFLAPLLLMGVYLLAFATVFRVRLGVDDTGLDFAAFALAGLAPWVALQDAAGRAPVAVTGNANLVKQIVFPSEVLPMRVVLASLPALGIGLVVTIAISLVAGKVTSLGLLVLLPLAVLFHMAMVIGCAYILAAIGVFLRDMKDVVGLLLSVGIFVHPVFYAPASVPSALGWAFTLSPFSHMIWCYRDALFYGEVTRPISWLVAPIAGAVLVTLGWRVFRMLKVTFGNAL